MYTLGVRLVEELCLYVRLPANLSGKRVLDIGALNRCCSFECERRGAEEVVAYSLEDPEENGFNRLKELLGPNLTVVIESFQSAGFDCEHLQFFRDRTTFSARINDTRLARLLVHCSEASRFDRDIVGLSSTFTEASGA